MEYREAMKIGSRAEGIIKCTYAELYNKKGVKLISLQNYLPRSEDKYAVACVEITEISNKPLVPCYLLDDAFQRIISILEKKKRTNDGTPDVAELVEQMMKHKFNIDDYQMYGKTYCALLSNLEQQVLKNEPFYVKPAAFDWFPVNTNNMNGGGTNNPNGNGGGTNKTKFFIVIASLLGLLCGK